MVSGLTDEPVNKIRHHLTHQSPSSTIFLYNSEFQKNQMPFSCNRTVVRIVWLRGRVGVLGFWSAVGLTPLLGMDLARHMGVELESRLQMKSLSH
ncbi:hypothetical protein BSZ32_03420 [Rubritalea profundi]|uniref:Uncharacterized protein n=1 Tax=Rubritalea profundi TaxID=1658618 RepID=A0A2S7TY20_9BACT|nr:hypothetical protein BSZ32_03420 [Rubritalea profundi]